MEKTYNPQNIECKIYQNWEQANYFQAKSTNQKDQSAWSLMIPPPNVTGNLHMGHAFQDTIMDCLTRFHRMKGNNTLWQPGTDHAGIATQMLVERQLEAQGLNKENLGREKFVEKIWQWKNQSGGSISQQLRRMGASVDWSRECFTMDEKLSKAVIKVFVDLYEQGLIYKGKRLVNWDPKLLSAISDLEVINKEEQGYLYSVRYPFVDQVQENNYLIIATTRPETILADGALAVNPNDERYLPYIGKKVWVPMTQRQIPIIVDDYVQSDFGTGCVKITPAHDFNDYAVGQRHEMEVINLFTPAAKMNENAPKQYQGLDRFDARKKIISDLKSAGLLEEIKDHTFKRPYGDRSGAVIEPYMTDQWFVKADVLAKPAIKAVKNKSIKFIPENWDKTYYQWLENIQDWCISRQLWWGHRIPVWYDDQGNHYVAENLQQAQRQALKKGIKDELRQDEDVLDTWFSSALWPFSTLGWPENTDELNTFYPTNVLVTGFDIIFFWVARMVMFGLHFTGKIPFKEVYIHGLVRDSKGDKMSKSKGNVLDPIDIIDGIELEKLIEKRTTGLMQSHMAEKIKKDTIRDYPNGIIAYGCDALRFTFTALASTGRDIRFDLSRCEGYRNFCNKLWNAARFTLMQLDNNQTTIQKTLTIEDKKQIQLVNQWIDSKIHQTIKSIEEHLKSYRFDIVSTKLYEFIWNDFCDWYIEAVKPYLNSTEKDQICQRLVSNLEIICCLTHPIIPFITEEIWQQIQMKTGKNHNYSTIVFQPYPEYDEKIINVEIEQAFTCLQNIISTIRSIRSQAEIKPNKSIKVVLENCNSEQQQILQHYSAIILSFCNATEIKVNQPSSMGNSAVSSNIKITIPFEDNKDIDKEIDKLNRELSKLETQNQIFEKKLGNEQYLSKAPTEVINTAKEKQQIVEKNIFELKELIDRLNKARI